MGLDDLETLRGAAGSLIADDLRSQLAAKHSALHAAQELLARPITGQGEVLDGRLLRRPVPVPAGDGRVDAAGNPDHSRLRQLGAAAGQLGANLRGEEALQLPHGGVHDLLVGLLQPVNLAACKRSAGRKDKLEHGLLLVVVLLAARAHVGVHRQERAAAEAQVVDVQELPVKPHVDVDDRDALQLVDLSEEGVGGPLLGHHALHDVARHGRDVLISLDDRSVTHEDVLDGIVLVQHELVHRAAELDLAAPGLDVLLHGSAEAVGLVAVQEGHLQAIGLVQETVHRRQHHRHGELVRIDEVEGLGHGDEHLIVDAVRHAILLHELTDGQVILLVDEILALHQHREKRGGSLKLLRHREHLLVQKNGQGEVQGSRDALEEIERGELAGQLLHSEDHLVALPLQAVLNVELREEVHHVGVGAEEDVEARLDPVTILVLPRGDLAAKNVPCLQHKRLMPSIHEVLGAGEAGQAAADDGDLLLLALPLVGKELLGQRLTLEVVGRLADFRRRGVVLRQGPLVVGRVHGTCPVLGA
mmetsp:Transcript_12107/g.35977  ORF Transcript_12107/g.35977 Transcript_12107/m.35977 type:complete len:531 (+) Transcript_12107:270-1862(+)